MLGWDCKGSGIICLYCCLKKLHFTTKRVCQIQFVARVCNHYPMLTLHIAGLRIYNGKSLFVESRNTDTQTEANETKYRLLSSGIRLIICWRESLSILDNFFNKHQTCQLQPITFVPPIQ